MLQLRVRKKWKMEKSGNLRKKEKEEKKESLRKIPERKGMPALETSWRILFKERPVSVEVRISLQTFRWFLNNSNSFNKSKAFLASGALLSKGDINYDQLFYSGHICRLIGWVAVFQFWRSSSESTLPTLRTNVDSTRVKTWEGKLLQRFKSQSMLLVTTKEKKVCDINLLWILGLVTNDDYVCINRLEAHISNI